MKVINMEMNKLNIGGVCLGCMNADRKMYQSSKIKECFKLIADIEILDGLTVKVCWECMAYINNMFKFKNTIERSYGVLFEYYMNHISLENLTEMCANVPQRLGLMAEQVVDIPSDLHVPTDELAIKIEGAWDFNPVEDEEFKEDPILGSPPTERTAIVDEILKNCEVRLVALKQIENIKSEQINETPNPFVKTDGVTRYENLYVCKFCAFKCKQKTVMRTHLYTHTEDKTLCCDLCAYRCSDEASLKAHIYTHLSTERSDQPSEEIFSEEHAASKKADKMFSCPTCPYKSAQRGNLKRHMFKHTGEKPYKCATCPFQCSKKPAMDKHVCPPPDAKTYRCQLCTYTCWQSGNLKRHMYRHSKDKPYKCEGCPYQCTDKRSLAKHSCSQQDERDCVPESEKSQTTDNNYESGLGTLPVNNESKPSADLDQSVTKQCSSSKNENKNTTDKAQSTVSIQKHTREMPFSCRICSYKSALRSNLRRHMYTHASEKPYKCGRCSYQCIDKRLWEKHKQTCSPFYRKPLFICQFCTYKTYQQSFLKSHMTKAHKNEQFHICEKCSYQCTEEDSFRSHACRKKEENMFRCKLCSFKSNERITLRKHMRIHTAQDQLCCEYCGKIGTKSALVLHMRSHTGEKPFACDVCPYKSCRKANLMAHVRRVHAGEKPFCCDYCPYKCADKGNMVVHLTTHTGEKPFSCNLCPYKSITSTNLKRHMFTHTGEKLYSCPYCSHRFTLNSTLKIHIRTHTDERPYSCRFCSYKSRTRNHMKKHTKRQHTIKDPIAT